MVAPAALEAGSNRQPTANRAVAATSVNEIPVAQIIESNGESRLKRQNWQEYRPAFVGTELYPGDRLQLAPRTNLIAACYADGKIWKIPAGTTNPSKDCPPPQKPIDTTDGPISPPRSPDSVVASNIPYIISPRSTSLLSNQPALRWNPVAGATLYTVRLKGNAVIWETETSQTQILYPQDKPSLEPGVYYSLIVDASTGTSSLDEDTSGKGFGFTLINEEDAKVVRAAIEKITAQKLLEEAQALALASLYRTHNLKADAIDTLEASVAQGSKTAAVYRILGDLYWQLGLAPQAEAHYSRTVELSPPEDLEGQSQAQASLGEVYILRGNQQEAIRRLQMARDGYAALGDSQRVSELESRLKRINK